MANESLMMIGGLSQMSEMTVVKGFSSLSPSTVEIYSWNRLLRLGHVPRPLTPTAVDRDAKIPPGEKQQCRNWMLSLSTRETCWECQETINHKINSNRSGSICSLQWISWMSLYWALIRVVHPRASVGHGSALVATSATQLGPRSFSSGCAITWSSWSQIHSRPRRLRADSQKAMVFHGDGRCFEPLWLVINSDSWGCW